MGQVLDITAVSGDERKKKFFSVLSSEYKDSGVTTNATPDTYAATEGFLVIYNGQVRGTTPNQNVLILPDFVKLTCATIPVSGDNFMIIWKTDIINRWTSGGTSLTTLAANHYVATYPSFTRITTSAVIHAGDLTCPAASSEAAVGISEFRNTVGAVGGIIGDQFITQFGGSLGANSIASTVSAMKFTDVVSPVVLGPGSSLIGHLVSYGASGAAELKVEIGWTELHHDFNA